jgi:hypothetical protein
MQSGHYGMVSIPTSDTGRQPDNKLWNSHLNGFVNGSRNEWWPRVLDPLQFGSLPTRRAKPSLASTRAYIHMGDVWCAWC